MELRKDYILDRWTIIASNRGKRPEQFKKEPVVKTDAKDFFAPGNEELTPPEIMRILDKNGDSWKIRVIPNKFAAVLPEGDPKIKTVNDFFTWSSAYGNHEVVVETPDNRQMWDFSVEELKAILEVYRTRINEIFKDEKIKYVQVFKNHGKEGGTSLVHSHSQIIAYNKIPMLVNDKIEACKKHGKDAYEKIIAIEKNSERKCFENDTSVAFTPYASRYPFELLIFPKEYAKSLNDLDDKKLSDLAELMNKALSKLKTIHAPFNMYLHYAPEGSELHMHFIITPRLTIRAGYEIGTDEYINIMPPEKAAEFYRGDNS